MMSHFLAHGPVVRTTCCRRGVDGASLIGSRGCAWRVTTHATPPHSALRLADADAMTSHPDPWRRITRRCTCVRHSHAGRAAGQRTGMRAASTGGMADSDLSMRPRRGAESLVPHTIATSMALEPPPSGTVCGGCAPLRSKVHPAWRPVICARRVVDRSPTTIWHRLGRVGRPISGRRHSAASEMLSESDGCTIIVSKRTSTRSLAVTASAMGATSSEAC